MKRYFEESVLMEMLEGMEDWDEPGEVVDCIRETIRTAVPADAAPVIYAKWSPCLRPSSVLPDWNMKCSNCGNRSPLASDYCMSCGAKMDGGEIKNE